MYPRRPSRPVSQVINLRHNQLTSSIHLHFFMPHNFLPEPHGLPAAPWVFSLFFRSSRRLQDRVLRLPRPASFMYDNSCSHTMFVYTRLGSDVATSQMSNVLFLFYLYKSFPTQFYHSKRKYEENIIFEGKMEQQNLKKR